MLNDIYDLFERRGFITYDALLDSADDLQLSNPRGAVLTLLGCRRSIFRALDILEDRAGEKLPLLYMIGGLRYYMTMAWEQLDEDNSLCVLNHADIRTWRQMRESVCIAKGKLEALAELFLGFADVVVAMQLLTERLLPEREGRDFARMMTPVLFIAYLTKADSVPPEYVTEPIFYEHGLVPDELLDQAIDEIPGRLN